MSPIQQAVLSAAILVLAGGCQMDATRPWQQTDLPTHDRQMAFDAAKTVLARHFEIADSSWTRGTIETRPRIFTRKATASLADIRGAGGRWRRTAFFEFDTDGSTVIALVAVRVEREGTAQAAVIAQAGGDAEHPVEAPKGGPISRVPSASAREEVWTDMGYDAAAAKELLNEITAEIVRRQRREVTPTGLSPEKEAEEARRLGEELNK
jgi:hypothetical protein